VTLNSSYEIILKTDFGGSMFKYFFIFYIFSTQGLLATTIPYQSKPKYDEVSKPTLSWTYAYAEEADDTLGDSTNIPWEEFKNKFERGKVNLFNDRIKWEATARELDRHKKNVNFVLDALLLYPEYLNLVIKKPTDARKLGINYIFKFKDNDGIERRVVTYGDEYIYGILADALRIMEERGNSLNIYNMLYTKFPKNFLEKSNLTSPRDLLKADNKTILAEITSLTKKFKNILKLIPVESTPPEGYPTSCDQEIGDSGLSDYYYNGDLGTKRCDHHPDGIYNNVNYPLKYYATCVKNQASRGLCVTFATISALETAFAVKEKKWYNFSEEHLNNSNHMKWFPSDYGDGTYLDRLMKAIMDNKYKIALEKEWIYNPSFFRLPMPNRTYINSCPEQYEGLHCSETSHQGKGVYTQEPGTQLYYFGYTEETPVTEKTPTSTASISNIVDSDWATEVVCTALNSKIPIATSIPITNSFKYGSTNGYVEFTEELEANIGGFHAVAVLGCVKNEDLPPGAPPGAGGGYMVIKNSWAACWKDAGYAYLPIDWMKRYATMYSMIDAVQ